MEDGKLKIEKNKKIEKKKSGQAAKADSLDGLAGIVLGRFGGSKSGLRRISIGFVSVLPMEKRISPPSLAKRLLAGIDSNQT